MWSVCVLVMLTLLSSAVMADDTECADPKTTSGTLSVRSRRNQTGHWLMEVSLDRPADEPQETSSWEFDLSFSRSGCGAAETLHMKTSLTVPPPRAGPGYVLYDGVGYYKLHSENKTWEEALAACEAEGAHLAIINSEEESSVIEELFVYFPDLASDWASIGFHDKFVEGQYLTIFGQPLNSTGFTRWYNGQPDNYGDEDCGSVHRNSGLNDLNCEKKVAFICEQEL